eukprot:5215475-Amphidinium_carterae.1
MLRDMHRESSRLRYAFQCVHDLKAFFTNVAHDVLVTRVLGLHFARDGRLMKQRSGSVNVDLQDSSHCWPSPVLPPLTSTSISYPVSLNTGKH